MNHRVDPFNIKPPEGELAGEGREQREQTGPNPVPDPLAVFSTATPT